jgi:IS5 family transposase
MLRIYCLQQWYNLSDPGAEEALYDIQSMRAFCNLELGRDPIPDETTILNFRHLLEAHGLTKTVFEAVAEHLEARGALLRGGTIVDATLIAASASTKNEAGKIAKTALIRASLRRALSRLLRLPHAIEAGPTCSEGPFTQTIWVALTIIRSAYHPLLRTLD